MWCVSADKADCQWLLHCSCQLVRTRYSSFVKVTSPLSSHQSDPPPPSHPLPSQQPPTLTANLSSWFGITLQRHGFTAIPVNEDRWSRQYCRLLLCMYSGVQISKFVCQDTCYWVHWGQKKKKKNNQEDTWTTVVHLPVTQQSLLRLAEPWRRLTVVVDWLL